VLRRAAHHLPAHAPLAALCRACRPADCACWARVQAHPAALLSYLQHLGVVAATPCPPLAAFAAAGCAHTNVTVEAGKRYLFRLISATSLVYQVRWVVGGAARAAGPAAGLRPLPSRSQPPAGAAWPPLSGSLDHPPNATRPLLPLTTRLPVPCPQTVCFPGHKLTIVAADAIPVKPIRAPGGGSCVDINSGQRCALQQRLPCRASPPRLRPSFAPAEGLPALCVMQPLLALLPLDGLLASSKAICALLPSLVRLDVVLRADQPLGNYWITSQVQFRNGTPNGALLVCDACGRGRTGGRGMPWCVCVGGGGCYGS
jgi:hypothetical protein